MFNILFLYIKPDTSRAKPMYLCSEPARANNCSFSFSRFFYFSSFHLSGERPFVFLMIFFLSFNLSAEIPFVFHIRSFHLSDDFGTFFKLYLSTFQEKYPLYFLYVLRSFHLSGERPFVFLLIVSSLFFKRQLIYFESYWNNTFLNIIDH